MRAMSDETTTEQLAEIEGQAADTPATEYTPPEGWRVLAVGEVLRAGDVWVWPTDDQLRQTLHAGAVVGAKQRYIRPIESRPEPQPQAEPEPQPQPQPVQVREGRWRTRGGEIRNVTPRPAGDGRKDLFPWWDAAYGGTWTSGGRYYFGEESPLDLDEYLGPIEPQAESQPEADRRIELLRECNARQAKLIADLKYERSGAMERAEVSARGNRKLTEQIDELRSEVSYVQRLLGESRQRVTHLEELVTSLRTINGAQEKSFNAANKANDDLQHRLNVVAAEWAEQAETIRRLQIELDAAQQVPQAIADRFEEGWNQGTARAVETIAEWLQAFRGCNSPALALLLLEALPSIMRSLTGLTPED